MNLVAGLCFSRNALGLADMIREALNYCWREWVKLRGENIPRCPKILEGVFKSEMWKFLKYQLGSMALNLPENCQGGKIWWS